ncbi:MAG: hypothetical protein OEQ39_13955 [Gammaproteobacteria bacterium]|nr:hypothetical protein [Gammaproteobacteria bacterium]MDH3467439.1 hypothetical protein [Gammaproteobacteria bacterium]
MSTAVAANFAPLKDLSDADFQFALNYKLMDRLNLVHVGGDDG